MIKIEGRIDIIFVGAEMASVGAIIYINKTREQFILEDPTEGNDGRAIFTAFKNGFWASADEIIVFVVKDEPYIGADNYKMFLPLEGRIDASVTLGMLMV